MRIGLLGELEVVDDDGTAVVLGAAKLRSLLAVLALHAGQAVPAEQLVEAGGGDDPPAAGRDGLQGLVSKPRPAPGPDRAALPPAGGGPPPAHPRPARP